MSLGDWVWIGLGLVFLAFELPFAFIAPTQRNTLSEVVRRWLGIYPKRPWRRVTIPALWIALAVLGWHLTVG